MWELSHIGSNKPYKVQTIPSPHTLQDIPSYKFWKTKCEHQTQGLSFLLTYFPNKSPSSTLKPRNQISLIDTETHSAIQTQLQHHNRPRPNLKSHPTWSIINTHHNPWEWEQRSTYYKSHNITMHTYIFLEPYILVIYLYIIKKAIHFYKFFGLISHTSKSTHKQKFMSTKCYIKHPDHTDLVRLAYGIRTREAASDSSGSSLHYSYVPPL